jgi:FO synthase subunit 2
MTVVRTLSAVLDEVKGGSRLSGKDALMLFKTSGRQVWEIAEAADEVREERAGNAVTYVRNQNINVTNLCVNACGFCGFSKKPGDEGIYFHDRAAIQKKVSLAKERRVTEICTVSGLHPDFTAQSYTDVDPRGSTGNPHSRQQPDGSCVCSQKKQDEHGRSA